MTKTFNARINSIDSLTRGGIRVEAHRTLDRTDPMVSLLVNPEEAKNYNVGDRVKVTVELLEDTSDD